MSSQSTPFAFVGTVLGGGIGSLAGPAGILKGAQIGATVGTVAQGIFAKPTDTAKGGDAHWGGVTFGTAIPRGWAQHRTDGFVFWAQRNKDGTYLFPHSVGKGKEKGGTSVKHFHATFAFHILDTGWTFPDGRQVERAIVVDRVWMADKIVWVSPDAAPLPAWDPSAIYYTGDFVSHSGHTYWSIADGNSNHEPGHSGGTWWQMVSTSKNLNLSFHPQVGESTFTMSASSVVASHKGVGNTPARRGSTYGVADDIDTYDLGNSLPWGSIRTDWHFADPTYTLGEFLSDVCGMSGMPAGSYDFSDVTELMPGYRQTARQAGADLVTQPLSVLGYDLATIDGVVRAVKRGGPIVASLSLSELGAGIEGQSLGTQGFEGDLISEDLPADNIDLHSSLKLGYYNASAGFRQDFESSIRGDHSLDNPTDLQTDLVLTDDRAAQAAGYLLDAEQLEAGANFGASVLGTWAMLCPSDPVTIPWNGLTTRFRITKVVRGIGLLQLTLARDEPSTTQRYELGQAKDVSAPDNGQIVPTLFLPLSPATDLSNDFAQYAGFYLFANGPAGWSGGEIMFTFDAPGSSTRNWVDGGFVATESVFGTMTTALADAGGVTPTVPAAPAGLSATGGNAQVSLSWSTVSGATSYSVKRSTVSGGPYTTVATGLASASYTDAGRTNGTAFYYVVSATNAVGEGPNSGEASATPTAPTSPPSAPASVVATGRTSRVGVDWSPSTGAASYTLKRGTTSGTYPTTVATGLTSPTDVDSGLTNGTTYHYAVVAVNAAGSSSPSSDVSAVPIAIPTGLAANPGSGSVALAWNSAVGATGYRVYWGTASGGPYTLHQDVTGTSTLISGLANGTAYWFIVTGTNTIGESDGSSQVSATPAAGLPTNPGSPSGGTGI